MQIAGEFSPFEDKRRFDREGESFQEASFNLLAGLDFERAGRGSAQRIGLPRFELRKPSGRERAVSLPHET